MEEILKVAGMFRRPDEGAPIGHSEFVHAAAHFAVAGYEACRSADRPALKTAMAIGNNELALLQDYDDGVRERMAEMGPSGALAALEEYLLAQDYDVYPDEAVIRLAIIALRGAP